MVDQGMTYSLFYFSSDQIGRGREKYRLLLEGARFADRNGFAAIWTPERHFHPFGALYPNPAITNTALAMITERVRLRSGSVVLPLHDPIRVAEEWAVVDNLSNGRVDVAFASGWHSDDFVFFPDRYQERKELMFEGIETVRRLWRGETITVRSGSDADIDVRIFPQPVQEELPFWVSAGGSPETFQRAGECGGHLLTHILGQNIEELAEKIRIYREARASRGLTADSGQVALMMHAFLGEDREKVREQVRVPFINYLRSSLGLLETFIRRQKLPLDINNMSQQDMDDVLEFAFTRYFETNALFGEPEECVGMIGRLRQIGVDEVACLIDFGVDVDAVLESLSYLAMLKDQTSADTVASPAGGPKVEPPTREQSAERASRQKQSFKRFRKRPSRTGGTG